jgi:hypothetical protein
VLSRIQVAFAFRHKLYGRSQVVARKAGEVEGGFASNLPKYGNIARDNRALVAESLNNW